MNNTEKSQIKKELKSYVELKGSQNKAAKTLRGISSATISQMLNDNWDLITDEMWRALKTQISSTSKNWEIVPTRDFNTLQTILNDSQFGKMVFAITGDAGTGKTATVKNYANNNKQTYLLHCNEYWNRKYFLTELATQIGIDVGGLTVAEIMGDIVHELKRQENPIIILDEADKLKDQVLQFFITLYNELEDIIGLILLATNHLKKRIERGVKLNKRGYKEIYSRIGRNFIPLKGVGYSDVLNVCVANGIEDKKQVKEVFENCEGDLRRVKRNVFILKVA